MDYSQLTQEIKDKATAFGFIEATIASIKVDATAQQDFTDWLNNKFYGDMDYLARNTQLRFHPELLHNGTVSIICVKASYLTKIVSYHQERLQNPAKAYVSSYALGRDYHKVLRKQLTLYSNWIKQHIAQYNFEFDYRVFTDSAPIMEIELAKNSGSGWRGKNTLLLNKEQGSMFFLGEIFTNLPLLVDSPTTAHCGSCTKCMVACPTNAFIAPYVLDATKCISYLTIENKGSIPIEYRKAIGNRIYGCDDCQLVCPWNKFSKLSTFKDFATRNNLDNLDVITAFLWTKNTWMEKMQGSAIYRIGYDAWLRNVAIALGNAPTNEKIVTALKSRLDYPSEMVKEHVAWALMQHLINNNLEQ